MVLLPQTTEYALKAVLRVARRYPRAVPAATLAAEINAPANYLAKTLSQLVRAGVLVATRGPAGGFRLAESPQHVILEQIVRVFDRREAHRCLLGDGTCGSVPDCPVHARWSPVGVIVDDFFRSTTIADLTPSPSDPSSSSKTSNRSKRSS